ncbi:mitochondrial import inner membrane translocase subunit tim54 [Coemansia guatemalensis]|uniref:Mitochondrial import inner membrane translocase subunit TIM54 n=1 Tax=Coemansia guatemalensis TaxID=2761395 RepID=A0A9W8HSZ7_9FUNG|nr:mitochondrial import inner membrane translocase subunit tim54 [Coemansia guatemalensis]
MFARIRKKLPGPKTVAFWGSVTGAVGFYKYNKHESQKRLDYYCQRAAQAANETMGSMDTARKVHVYIAVPMGELGTRRARQHWEKYILPVFAAGALDYELTLVNETEVDDDGTERVVRGGVHRMVAEEIKERRRRQLEAEEDNGELRLWRAAIEERESENEARRLKKRLGEEPGMSVLELWKAPEYPGVMDVVAIGRETWVEMVNGISDGAVGSLNKQVPALVPLHQDHQLQEIKTETRDDGAQVTDTAGGESANETQAAAAPAEPIHMVNYDRYDEGKQRVELPAAAFISHRMLSGWGAVPQRVWNFFHDQQNVDEYARQALQVVFESTRRAAHGVQELESLGREEEELPGWENQQPMDVVVDSTIADRLQIYDTQKDTAPCVSGTLADI